jgi:hypothetical protein
MDEAASGRVSDQASSSNNEARLKVLMEYLDPFFGSASEAPFAHGPH